MYHNANQGFPYHDGDGDGDGDGGGGGDANGDDDSGFSGTDDGGSCHVTMVVMAKLMMMEIVAVIVMLW